MKSFFAVGLLILLAVVAVQAGVYPGGSQFCAQLQLSPLFQLSDNTSVYLDLGGQPAVQVASWWTPSISQTYQFKLNIRCTLSGDSHYANCLAFSPSPIDPNRADIDDAVQTKTHPKPIYTIDSGTAVGSGSLVFLEDDWLWASVYTFTSPVVDPSVPAGDSQHNVENVKFSILFVAREEAGEPTSIYTGDGSGTIYEGQMTSDWVAVGGVGAGKRMLGKISWVDTTCPGSEPVPQAAPPVEEPIFAPQAEPPVDPPVYVPPPVAPPVYVAPPVAPPVYVAPPVAPPVYVAPPVNPPVYVAPPVAPPVYVAPPVAPPVYVAPPVSPPVYVAPPVAPPVYVAPPVNPPVYIPPPVAPPVYVAPPVDPPVFVPPPPPVYVAPPVNPPVYVAPPVDPPVYIPPPVYVAPPPTPVAQPPTPVAQPPTPVAQPPTPVAQPPTPVAQPPTPVAQPPTLVAPKSSPAPVATPNAQCQPRGGRGKPRWCPSFLFGESCNCWIVPIVECVEMLGDRDFLARFGFQVKCLGRMPSVIQIDIGDNNRFEAPAMPDNGQPWNFCVPPDGRVRNAFSHRWTGAYGLTWKIGKFLASTSRFNQCSAGAHTRDIPTTRAIDSGRAKRDYSGTNDAEAGRGWGNFLSVQNFIRKASTTFSAHIYRQFWFLVDTVTVFRGTTPNCQAIAIKAQTSKPVSFTFYSDLITISGKTAPTEDNAMATAKFYTNLPSWTDSSKSNLPWEVHVDAGEPNSWISTFIQYECIQPGDYLIGNSGATVAVSALLVALVALLALLF